MFEKFLEDKFEEQRDNPIDSFENWESNLDVQELIDYADEFGDLKFEEGVKESIKTLDQVQLDLTKEEHV